MRHIDPELQRRLTEGATTLCRCWRVRRYDGIVLGFTDHDGDITFEGTVFLARTGMNASAIQATTGLAVDNAQAVGALTAAGITEAEIAAGRYDGAEVEHWLVDWTEPSLNVLMFAGRFGEIRRMDGMFEVELRGPTDALNVPIGRTLQRTCDRQLGDAKCRFALDTPGFSAETSVSDVLGPSRFAATGLEGFAAGWFESGSLTWLSGPNFREMGSVKVDKFLEGARRQLSLWNEPGAAVSVGDRFVVRAGCDKRLETCRRKFDNLLNFRGFPHIPGDDWVAAYPKNGEVHDGSSRMRG